MSSFEFTFTVPFSWSANDPPKTPPKNHSMLPGFQLHETPRIFPRTPNTPGIVEHINVPCFAPDNAGHEFRRNTRRLFGEDSDEEDETPRKRICYSSDEDDDEEEDQATDVGTSFILMEAPVQPSIAVEAAFSPASGEPPQDPQVQEPATLEHDATDTRVQKPTNNVHPSNSSGDEDSSAYDPMKRPFPQSWKRLARYIAEGVSIRALFPSTERKRGGRKELVCRATHKRVGDSWVVMEECGNVERGTNPGEWHQRHIKMVHLGEGEMTRKAGLDLLSWIRNYLNIQVHTRLAMANTNIKVQHWPAGQPIPMTDEE